MIMNSRKIKHYAETTKLADEIYELWGKACELEMHGTAADLKEELEQLIKELDKIGDCNHKYKGINC